MRGWGNETGATVAGRLYEDGVRASMDYYSIASDKADEYISHLKGKEAFGAGGSREEQLEQIITQNGWLSILTVTKVGLRFAAQIIPVICCCRVMATTQAVRWRIPN